MQYLIIDQISTPAGDSQLFNSTAALTINQLTTRITFLQKKNRHTNLKAHQQINVIRNIICWSVESVLSLTVTRRRWTTSGTRSRSRPTHGSRSAPTSRLRPGTGPRPRPVPGPGPRPWPPPSTPAVTPAAWVVPSSGPRSRSGPGPSGLQVDPLWTRV